MKAKVDPELENIKNNKIEEAEEIYEKIGLSRIDQNLLLYGSWRQQDTVTKDENEILHWTRLSNNSDVGCTID